MAITYARSNRKPTGGLYHKFRKKKKRDFGSDFIPIKIGKPKRRFMKTLGGSKKIRVLQANVANVLDPSTGKYQISKIKAVKENPANPFFVVSNTITKGAIIETELGLAKVVSRPGQDGVINAVLVKK